MTHQQAPTEEQESDLWKDKNFMSIFGAHTVSEFGSVVTRDALPFLAVMFLSAQPLQMSILSLAGVLPVLLIALPGGVLIDRIPRIPVMLISDLVRALFVLMLPVAWYFDVLSFWHLVVVVFVTALFTAMYELADQSLLPELLKKKDLLSGNSKIASADTAAEVVASSITGWLIQVLGGPIVLIMDVFSYLLSAVFILRIKVPANPESPKRNDKKEITFLQDLKSGFKIYAQSQPLKAYLLTSVTQAFFGSFLGALYIIHLVNTLNISIAVVGILIALGGIGGFTGAILAEKVSKRTGAEEVMFYSMLLRSFATALLPLSVLFPPLLAIVALGIHQIFGDFLFVQYQINERTRRQQIVAVDKLGRVNSTAHFTVTAAFSLGLIIAGIIGQFGNTTIALTIASVGIFALAVLFKVFYLNRRTKSQ